MKYLVVLFAIASCVFAMSNINGTMGVIRAISADNGSAGTFHFGFHARGFYENRTADGVGDSISESWAGTDAAYGGGEIYGFLGYALTDWFSFNVGTAFLGDGIDYEGNADNRASTGFGDTEVGLKFGFGGEHLMYGLYTMLNIPTGADRDISALVYGDYPIFNAAYSNPGGVYRYFSTDGFDIGMLGLFTYRQGIMDFDLNLGYVLRNAEGGGLRNNASIYNAAITLNAGAVAPFVELSGIDFSGKDKIITFTDDSLFGPNEVYITPGLSFRPSDNWNINVGVDIRAIEGENERDFPTPQTDSFNITTGYGVSPSWALHFGFAYTNDFIPEKPVMGNIAGTVTNSVTGEPVIANVNLMQNDMLVTSQKSSAEGFMFMDVEPGTYDVEVTAVDYKPYEVGLFVKSGETTPLNVALVPVPKEGKLILTIIDLESKKPMKAQVMVGPMAAEMADGSYTKTLKAGVYTVKVNAEDKQYLPYERSITMEAGKTLELEVALVKKEFKIVLPNVYFEFDKSDIKPESYSVLDEAAKTIKTVLSTTPDAKFEVQGHTDSKGSDAYNQKLSDARANSVKNYLVTNHQIPGARLMARGYGESKPVASNDSDAGRAKNRRVEFVVIK